MLDLPPATFLTRYGFCAVSGCRRVLTFCFATLATPSGSPWLRSAAAGGYQFMPATWAAAQRATGVPDFSPVSQDAAALYLIKQRGVDPNKMNELTPEIANALAPEWASFPTLKGVSYYGQPNKKVSALQQFYNRQLKRLSQ